MTEIKSRVPLASYDFISTWQVSAPVARCWTFLTSPDQTWVEWWPSLRKIEVQRKSRIVGSVAECVWRSPVGHRLRFVLTVTDVLPVERLVLASCGDLTGTAIIDFTPAGPGCEITVRWTITTTRRWMNVTAPLLRPVFGWAHHAVMRRGERGLNAVLCHDHERHQA